MLIVRSEQVAALSAEQVRRFEDRMERYIAAEHPDRYRALGEHGTRRLIRYGIATGARRGIDTEGAVGVLIELMLELGERFERSPDRAWIEEILAHPALPGQVKVIAIRERSNARTGGRRLVPARGVESA